MLKGGESMTQEAYIRKESRKLGIKRTIKVPAIVAGGMKQYDKTHDKLKSGIGVFGIFNAITIFNNDVVDVEVALDYAEEKTFPVPNGSQLSIDEVDYQSFNVINLDAGTAVTANKITISAIYEPSLKRDKLTSYKSRGGK
jgi:hypothetical protein